MENSFRSVAKDIPRLDAIDRVRGRPIYSADIFRQDSLILRVFRSTKRHARILRLDVDKARMVEGVEGIFTSSHIPGENRIGMITRDQPLLAEKKVRFEGEAVALVAARNERAAQEALEKIEVAYEDLEPVLDPLKALDEGAQLVHDTGNLLVRRTLRKGDVLKGFAGSDLIVERTYRTTWLEHTCLEPDAGVGHVYDADGTLVIVVSTQNPHYDRQEVARLLGIAEDRVRIIQAATGGGFGKKLDITVQGFIGLALHHLRRPVRLVFSREETYLVTTKRHPLTIEMKTGADRTGRLTALKARILCDTGAYASFGPAVATRVAVHATGPYSVENVEVESLCLYTNNPVCGAMRGFGVPQVAFAWESQIELIAEELGMDPLRIRRINALGPGSETATSQRLQHSIGILKALDEVEPYYLEAKNSWKKGSSKFERRGVGIGTMWYGIGNTGIKNPSHARLELDEKGRVRLYTGAADIGQGSTTVLAQIASEILGIEPEEMETVVGDTGLTMDAGATSASRQTYVSGNAVKNAALGLADMLRAEASELLGVAPERLCLESGSVVDTKDPGRSVPFKTISEKSCRKGISLSSVGHFDPETTPLDPETGQGSPYATYAFGCQLAMVRVDLLTGQVYVERIVAAHDVGRAINPEAVKGQIFGGVMMGLGFALMEEYIPGKTRSMKDYHIPTFDDMPEIVPIIIEEHEPTGPFGAKGVGEAALIPTAPAIVNAISDAVGERIDRLPASLERVMEALIRSGKFPCKEG